MWPSAGKVLQSVQHARLPPILTVVSASLKSPKADNIACPEIDRYNDHIIVKEKDVSI